MYKYILMAVFLFNRMYACDFCGCSPTVMNADMLSIQPQTSVGTSLQYRNFKHLVSDVNASRTQIITQSFFVSYAPKTWVDVRVSLPIMWIFNDYLTVNENTPNLKEKKFGISDMILFSNFRVWQKPPLGKKVGQVLNLGYGMSFPTGSKKTSENTLLQDFNFGTQSVGFLFSTAYSLSIKKWGLVNSAMVKVNMKNKDNTRYGHQYTYQVSGNYTAYIKKVALIPSIGLSVNAEQKNVHNNILQTKSGAWNLMLNVGLQCTVKGITLAASAVQPLAQKTSDGDILQKTGANFVMKYQIPRKNKMKMDMSTPRTY